MISWHEKTPQEWLIESTVAVQRKGHLSFSARYFIPHTHTPWQTISFQLNYLGTFCEVGKGPTLKISHMLCMCTVSDSALVFGRSRRCHHTRWQAWGWVTIDGWLAAWRPESCSHQHATVPGRWGRKPTVIILVLGYCLHFSLLEQLHTVLLREENEAPGAARDKCASRWLSR